MGNPTRNERRDVQTEALNLFKYVFQTGDLVNHLIRCFK